MVDDHGGRESGPVSFEAMFAAELERRGQFPRKSVVSLGKGDAGGRTSPVVGLALSGGGIRSAAFSLGVVQALEAEGIFPKVDYLSTVSGGGYTGAAIVASMIRNEGGFNFAAGPSGVGPDGGDSADSPEVRLIRDRCRYLMPNGWFDLFISLGIIFRGLVVNATIVSSLVFLAASIFLWCYPGINDLETSWLSGILGMESGPNGVLPDLLRSDFALSKLWFMALVGAALIWGVQRSIVVSRPKADQRSLSDPGSPFAKAMGAALVCLLVLAVFDLQQPVVRHVADRWRAGDGRPGPHVTLSDVLLVLATATAVLTVFWRALIGTVQDASRRERRRATAQALAAKSTMFVLASALPLLIYTCFLGLAVSGLSTPEAPQGSAVAWRAATDAVGLSSLAAPASCLLAALTIWSLSIGPLGETAFDLSWWKSGAARRPRVRRMVAVVAAMVLAGWPLQYLVDFVVETASPEYASAWLYAEIACTLGALAAVFTENANSLHRLYRDRLNEAFSLGSGDGRPFLLHELLPAKASTWKRRPPQLIVNAAVNMQGSRANRRARNADYFVFTGSNVGSDATSYASTEAFVRSEPHVDLATAVAISGAAVSAAMGRASVPLLAPTLALLNVRLGYWLRNPLHIETHAAEAPSKRRDWQIAYLALEAFGLLNETRRKVYVTDGGHIDNLGIRQLLKRRCDVVIVSDAEADPAMNFASLVDVERFARIDLGVGIELQWEPVRDAGRTRSSTVEAAKPRSPDWAHGAIGTIHYPARGAEAPKKGLIVYIKASVTGDERDYILDYERRSPRFPHEPTSDQFFTEEQFEAYRALGFHAARQTIGVAGDSDEGRRRLAMLKAARVM